MYYSAVCCCYLCVNNGLCEKTLELPGETFVTPYYVYNIMPMKNN